MSWKMLAGVVILISLLGALKYLFDQAEKKRRRKN